MVLVAFALLGTWGGVATYRWVHEPLPPPKAAAPGQESIFDIFIPHSHH